MSKVAALSQNWQNLPRLHRRLLLLMFVSLCTLSVWPSSKSSDYAINLSLNLAPSTQVNLSSFESPSEVETDIASSSNQLHYDINNGDSLSAIFDKLSIGQTPMYQIMQADQELLALDILRPGNRLIFHLDEATQELAMMELFINPANRVQYIRSDDGFYFEELILPGDWSTEILSGDIRGSFYVSAQNLGLTAREIQQISDLFREQLDFSRQIRAGDPFEVVRSKQYVDGEFTGQSRIEAVRIHRRGMSNTAYLFADGNYYDAKGDSLARAFMRYPFNGNYRISSAFNSNRLHPVTGNRSPHNGTDFAMRTGTPIVSSGDGVVTRVENHPFAGKYIEIEHSGQYKTRYLHMSRIDVRRGQRISRGERIGLSGATGRVTGPHLHYEFHINGRPVNPMTANIPLASAVPREHRADFNARVEEVNGLIERQASLAANP